MKRRTKARLSTVIGCIIGGVTLQGPWIGSVLADWQCKRGLCDHPYHLRRYNR